MSALDRALDSLIAGRWILTTQDTDDGRTLIVAHRPIGWTGPGDPHELLTADDHRQMRRLLARRHGEAP
ncbi:hypothetical protein [Nocardiopsis sp. NRRL B-16309]|uniref:hypothetical protein n=1 Tax=Nocardiopsis sp. NRRL B-16309 TaxID=1519494 RepID=UPI0006AE7BF4|nr:hypothetical protein [Nocardiopsis sp. NRRL B-16309]KOX16946.1 hypothetical protein ADL05_10050 [Nocardiopsis sp. NRRL B-16309]